MTDDDAERPPDSPAAPGDAGESADPFDGPDWTREATLGTGGRVRVRRRRPKRKARRRVLLGLAVLGLAVVAAGLWLLYTGFQARSELEAVRSGVHALRADVAAGDLAAARADAEGVRLHADRAHDLSTGPIWAGAAAIPYVGNPLATTRAVTSSVHAIADGALPALIDATHSLAPAALRRPDGSFDLHVVAAVAPSLRHASTVMSQALATIAGADDHTWLGQVNAARDDLYTQLTGLTRSVHSASVAATVLPPMLGADGPRTYLVSFENEAETRGLGGLPGAFAILRADQGKLSFVRFESDSALNGINSDASFGREFDVLWPDGPTALYQNSDESAHFPYAARIWAGMWQRKTGQRIDGAVALDPTTLSYLLEVTGPAQLPDHSTVTADNVVSLTQQRVYDRFVKDNSARKRYLLAIARAVATKLISSESDLTSLVKAAGKAAGEYRLVVWARDPAVESAISGLPLSGSVPPLAAPYAGLAMVNTLGSKLDYYLHTDFDWQRSGCGQFRSVTATIRLHNGAPTSGLPPYVLGYTGRPGFPSRPGTSRLSLYYYASTGAVLNSVTVDGKPGGAYRGYERTHPVFGIGLTMAPGSTTTVVLHLDEPAGSGPPVLRMQPLADPVQVHESHTSCGS